MSLVRYEPWNLLNQLHGDLDRLFSGRTGELSEETSNIATSDWAPAVDIKEDNDQYLIHADIPGVDPKEIEVSLENGVLTIKGERKSETREEREGYKRVERVRGTFFRRFSLPDTADSEKVSARSKDGVLEISIPKQEKASPRRISVKS